MATNVYGVPLNAAADVDPNMMDLTAYNIMGIQEEMAKMDVAGRKKSENINYKATVPTNTTAASTGSVYDNVQPVTIPTTQSVNLSYPQSIYNQTAPTVNAPTAINIQDVMSTMAPTVQNPYTRGLLERGLQQGQVPGILTPEGQAAEEARRIALLQETVTNPLEAQRQQAMRDVQAQMQKSGKLASSATIDQMMRQSEAYQAQVAAQLASGTLSIYDQVAAQYNEEANRQLQGGITQTEQQSAMQQSALNAAISQYQTQASMAINELQSQTQLQLAQIEADVTLSGYEKEARIAELQATTQKQVADIQGQYDQNVANISGQYQVSASATSGSEAAGIRTAADIAIANIEANTSVKVTEMNLAQADKELVQRAYEFDILQVDADGTPRWAKELALAELTQEQANELAWAKLKQDASQFDLTFNQGRTEFWAQLNWVKEKFGLTQEQAWDIFTTSMTENQRQFDLTRSDSRYQFNESMRWAREETGMTLAQQREIVMAQMQNDLANTQLTVGANLEIAANALAEQRDEFQLSQAQTFQLQSQILEQQNRELDYNIEMGWAQYRQDVRQFNMSFVESSRLAGAQLEIMRQNAQTTQDQATVQMLIDMNDSTLGRQMTEGDVAEFGASAYAILTADTQEERQAKFDEYMARYNAGEGVNTETRKPNPITDPEGYLKWLDEAEGRT